eukprot:CAMPEP_0198551890 /NCGR_PEP_ID=MMETSP1462-20131121/77624_1 /TAXON_ID=1333877 /ORGANISM="Brandtodinium nutriculum, Strain RCC3387" /LENGTH=134 /DNA_ID=CAMNT_0044282539 /DNA_START=62 /DNA_END=463 /DNA_ORIENTATION=+
MGRGEPIVPNQDWVYVPYYKQDAIIREAQRKEMLAKIAWRRPPSSSTACSSSASASRLPTADSMRSARTLSTSGGALLPERRRSEATELQGAVCVGGLTGRPELNGAVGSVVDSVPDAVGRVTVQLGGRGGEGK